MARNGEDLFEPVSLVTQRLDELTKEIRDLDTRRQDVAGKIAEHLANIRGWKIPVKAMATEKYIGDNMVQLSSKAEDVGMPTSGQLGPDYYEVRGMSSDLFGNPVVILKQGELTFAVKPESIQQVSDEDILAHRMQLDVLPEIRDLDD